MDNDYKELFENIPYKKEHATTNLALQEIELYSEKLKKIGFINNSYTNNINDTLIKCKLKLGLKLNTIKIYHNEKIDDLFLKRITKNFNPSYFEIPIDEIESTLNSIVRFYEKNGKSFTEVSLINLTVNENTLIAELNVQQSKQRYIDKIIMNGYKDFPNKFYKNYFNISPKSIFNIESLNFISNQLNTISFATQIKPPEVLFTKDSTIVYLYAKKKSINKFDGIIGFSNKENSNKIEFTGNLNFELNNIFNKGEAILLNWKSSINNHKLLNIHLFTPYIYNTKFSPSIKFLILKQDSIYTTTKATLNLNYRINQKNSFNTIYTNENSNTASSRSINNVDNFKKSFLGLKYTYTANSTNPLNLEFGYLIGSKKTTETRKQQTILEFSGDYSFSFNERNSIQVRQQAEILFSDKALENELYRIGGSSSIRGFDESAILTSKYSITNFEYHFNLNNNSELFSITDVGFIENHQDNLATYLIGIGVGYSVKTTYSNLSLGYALGKSKNNPFEFNNSKLHLKITYYF